MLSGPKAFDSFICFVAAVNSSMVKREVSMSSVSDTLVERKELVGGSTDFFPKRFLKWLIQFSFRLLAEPPLV